MSFLASQSKAWDTAHWEFSLVFEGLKESDLWRRPHPRLQSIGEIASHVIYWEIEYVNSLIDKDSIETPMRREEVRHYLTSIEQPLQLKLGVEELAAEFNRAQALAKNALQNIPADETEPMGSGPGRTLGELAEYLVFHVAFHAGQAFCLRHMMGYLATED